MKMELQQYANQAIEWLRASGLYDLYNKELSVKGYGLLSATKKISDITGEKINLEGLSKILHDNIDHNKPFRRALKLVRDYSVKFDKQKVVKELFKELEDYPYGYGPDIAFEEKDYLSLEVVPDELANVGYRVLQKAEIFGGNILHGAKILKKAKEIGAQIDTKQINREKIQESLNNYVFDEEGKRKVIPKEIYFNQLSEERKKIYEEKDKILLKEINSLFVDAGINLNLINEINETKIQKLTLWQRLFSTP